MKRASGSSRDFCGKWVKFCNRFLLAFADASGAGSASTEPAGQEQHTEEQDEPEGATRGTEEGQGGAKTDPLATVPGDEVEVVNEEEEEEEEDIEEDEYLTKFIKKKGPVSFTSSGLDFKRVM